MHNEVKKQNSIILNSGLKDSSSKLIFDDKDWCAQFLNDYVPIFHFGRIKPEDIEDVSEQFVPLFENERNADSVKKINIRDGEPFYLLSIIEHKTQVDYNVSMQIFRYMIYIWNRYEKEMEETHKGITKTSGFQYPPIIPIVYYEGKNQWTAPLNLHSRIVNGDLFGRYVPDFDYYLVPIHMYSKEELLEHGDEISLVMLMNRMQSAEDIEEFRTISPERLEGILADTPEYRREKMADILKAFLLKINVPTEEAEKLVSKVKEKEMGELFANIDKMDIQEERRKTAEARKELEEAGEKLEETKKELEETKEQLAQSKEAAICFAIETCKECGITREETVQKVMDKFGMDSERTEEMMSLYWK